VPQGVAALLLALEELQGGQHFVYGRPDHQESYSTG
jgi:hypothetical protein